MDITLTIRADESALEFARLLSKAPVMAQPSVKTSTAQEAKKETPTLEECRAKAADVMSSDPEKFKRALMNFSIRKVPELKPDQYAEFMEFLS